MFKKLTDAIQAPLNRVKGVVDVRASLSQLPDPGQVFGSIKDAMPQMGYASKIYHSASIWILVDPTYGLVTRITDKKARAAVQDIAELHHRAMNGGVSDEEWPAAASKAEGEISGIADANLQAPSLDIIKSTTGKQSLEKLNTASDALILVLACAVSQSSTSAAASAISAPIPTDIGKRLVYGQVKKFFGG